MKKINIAIDGPSAAGKSTIARELAKKLNYVHLDTGAMYRCVALKAYMNSISWENEEALMEMLAHTKIDVTTDNNFFIDQENVDEKIRSIEIAMGASHVSKHRLVRAYLVEMQQKMVLNKGYILDGRDIGSVVMVDAEVKIYQNASIETRALRRYLDNKQKGIECELEAILKDIQKRDYQDMNRHESPLIKVQGAIEIDTSKLTIDEAVNEIMKHVEDAIHEGGV